MTAPILIFGGSGGVGGALAKRLVADGETVHLVARDRGRLEAVSGDIGDAPFSVCDVTDFDALRRTIAAIADTSGIGGLAYCVGSIVLKPLKRLGADDLLAAFTLNAVGAALAVQAAEGALRASRGAVVLFSTVAARSGFANHTAIAMAKGAVESLTRSLAAELAPDVRVNCVAPSLIRTPLSAALTSSEPLARSIAALHPLPRLGQADDAAQLRRFSSSLKAAGSPATSCPLTGVAPRFV